MRIINMKINVDLFKIIRIKDILNQPILGVDQEIIDALNLLNFTPKPPVLRREGVDQYMIILGFEVVATFIQAGAKQMNCLVIGDNDLTWEQWAALKLLY